ncbi:MAG: hypothetical protein ACI9N9_000007 [Enterobacterales bacterium]|jgi:hypothetical protein
MAVTVASFINKYELSTSGNVSTAKLTEYITRYDTITLIELFGKELYDLYVIGIGAADPIYEFLRDAFVVQLDNGCILNSRGVDDMITGIVYFYYQSDAFTQQTINGSTKTQGENSKNVSLVVANIHGRWNEAIDTYQAIQDYICENLAVYPTFKGQPKQILGIF